MRKAIEDVRILRQKIGSYNSEIEDGNDEVVVMIRLSIIFIGV